MVDILGSLDLFISSYSYFGIFIAAFIETIFPPIPSEVLFPLAGFISSKSNFNYFQTFLMSVSGALGSTIGAILIYFLSYRFGRSLILKMGGYIFLNQRKIEKAEEWFKRYGIYAIIIGRLIPGIREIISIPAGISKMNFKRFAIFTFIGSLIWSSILVFSGYFFGHSLNSLLRLENISKTISIVLILVIVIGFTYYYLFSRINKRRK